ncbi:sulfurtransferase [Sediminivirga luteola]|uniref:sulfurtransferase n=1 Tax=Sediminivirga luteola TaxID=1774748 RepID=UPI001F57A54C|nr:sulfurtransferase [Sediminivirga luteola]MCI2264751.1 sulfurtransferase [Sediminivirga luteola]
MSLTNGPGTSGHLITPSDLHALLREGAPVRLLDVRWQLGKPDGREDFAAGHLPGAVFVDLPTELADPGATSGGRNPIPPVERLQENARGWGIRPGDTVVVYDDAGGSSAARAWWLLRHAGLEDVRVLDGALSAWRAAGLPLETGPGHRPEPGDVTLRYGAMPVLDADAAEEMARTGVLLDARAPERYRGETEPIDPVAGHIPGAANAPGEGNLGRDGAFLPPEQLRERYAGLGVTDEAPAGAYCGSGIHATHTVLALAVAGKEAALYPGSWSEWSSDPDRPVATGEEPGER